MVKTVGGGAFGNVGGAFGLRRKYTRKPNKVRRIKFIGVMTGALCEKVSKFHMDNGAVG